GSDVCSSDLVAWYARPAAVDAPGRMGLALVEPGEIGLGRLQLERANDAGAAPELPGSRGIPAQRGHLHEKWIRRLEKLHRRDDQVRVGADRVEAVCGGAPAPPTGDAFHRDVQ